MKALAVLYWAVLVLVAFYLGYLIAVQIMFRAFI